MGGYHFGKERCVSVKKRLMKTHWKKWALILLGLLVLIGACSIIGFRAGQRYHHSRYHHARMVPGRDRSTQEPTRPAPPPLKQIQQRIDDIFNNAFHGGAPLDLPDDAMDPLRQMQKIQREIDMMLSSALDDMGHFGFPENFDEGWNSLAVSPTMDMREESSNLVLMVTLPGMTTNDVHLTLHGSLLRIVAEKRNSLSAADIRNTSSHGRRGMSRIERMIRLPAAPERIDDVQARLENGLLRITVPLPSRREPLGQQVPLR